MTAPDQVFKAALETYIRGKKIPFTEILVDPQRIEIHVAEPATGSGAERREWWSQDLQRLRELLKGQGVQITNAILYPHPLNRGIDIGAVTGAGSYGDRPRGSVDQCRAVIIIPAEEFDHLRDVLKAEAPAVTPLTFKDVTAKAVIADRAARGTYHNHNP